MMSSRDDDRPAGLASIPVAAEFLSLSRNKLYQLINSGAVPSKRFGRSVRIPWQWLHQQAQIDCVDGESTRPD